MKPDYFGEQIEYMDLGCALRKSNTEEILGIMEDKIAEVIPQRIVIDPLTVVGGMLKGDYRLFLFDLMNRLKNWNATTLVTGEVTSGELYPPEVSYAVDGIVLLVMLEESGSRRKYLEVLKMRGTNHMTGRQIIDISRKDGVVVLKARF
jgi:circadian clock protein KaiC